MEGSFSQLISHFIHRLQEKTFSNLEIIPFFSVGICMKNKEGQVCRPIRKLLIEYFLLTSEEPLKEYFSLPCRRKQTK